MQKLRKVYVAAISTLVLAIATIIGTFFFNSYGEVPVSLQPKVHSDLPMQPMETFAKSLKTKFPSDTSNYPESNCPNLSQDYISKENQQVGINFTKQDWQNLNLEKSGDSALWVDKTSVGCGEKLNIHAALYGSKLNTFLAGPRTIEALRIGWYSGSGAREIWKSKPLKLKDRGVKKYKLASRLIEAQWPVTQSVKIDKSWIPGFYLIVTKSPEGKIENAAPLVVRAPLGTSKLVVMDSFLTWNTYNSFGGTSAYFGAGATKAEQRLVRSRVVSFDRPIIGSAGFSIHRDAISIAQFLEKSGLSADYASDLDIESWPSIISHYSSVILTGHTEYMTRRIMDSLIATRNSGTNIAILGGNTGIWQVRLTQSKVAKNRREIIYRKASEDPVVAPDQISIKFENPRINYPATQFTASLTSGVHVYGNLKAKEIPNWLKISRNASINGISPDSEVENYAPTAAAPPKVGIIFEGIMNYRDAPTAGFQNRKPPVADTLWYVAPSGSAVFNAGVMTWACDLVDTCAYSTVDEKSRSVLDEVTKQVLTLWQTKAIGFKISGK